MKVSHKISAPESSKLEQLEIENWSEYYRKLPDKLAWEYGLSFYETGGAGVMIASKVDMLAFNRVLGLGFTTPVTSDLLEDITSLYKDAGVKRFFIQLSPHAKAEVSKDEMENKGFVYYNNWVKLYRPVVKITSSETSLRIKAIGKEHAADFSSILAESFEWSSDLRPILETPIGRKGWRHYLAYDGEIPVACAAGFYKDEFASLAFAATLPEYRGLGAQSALIARRFNDAVEAGCKWMISETAEDKPDRSSASFRNLVRNGFRTAYLRPNYIYNFTE